MAVQFNGSQGTAPQNKTQFGQKAKFGYAPQAAASQRPGTAGKVQFGCAEPVSCACMACCGPFLALILAVPAIFLGKRLFRGIGGAGRGIGSGISSLRSRFSKKGGGSPPADAG